MNGSQVIHPVYLPFTVDQLREHLPPVARRTAEQVDRRLAYYTKSAQTYSKFCATYGDSIRKGKVHPHARHWLKLAELVGVSPGE